MKNKEITQKNTVAKSLIQLRLAIVFLIISATLLLSVPIFANNEFRVENCNKCEEYSQKLGKEISDFIELDNDPTKVISSQVTSAINEYRKKIIDLQTHPDVEKRILENEILLAYTQGNTAGRIAWVYYYNIYTFNSNASADKISAKYASCKTAIANATQYTVLTAECEIMLDELNKLIYTERAKNLALPTDSLSSSALISGAVESFKTLYSPDLFGSSYATEYSELVQELGLQRVRDALKKEAEEIFKIISPSESFSTSSSASLLIYELTNAQTIKKMNDAVIDFIEELLKIDTKAPYSSITKKKYLEESKTVASRATESQIAASLTHIFESYSLSIKKAEIKDSVYTLFLGDGSVDDTELITLEESFNKDSGIIDRCNSDSEVEAALINAKSMLFLHKHKIISNKSFDELISSDEQIAKDALIEYASLEEKVREKLASDINIIAEKYNNILIKKINEYLKNDALYLDFCEIIAKEIKSIPRDNIEDFYNKASKIPQKAEALARAISEYRSILSSDNYTGYNESEKKNLIDTLTELSNALSKIDPSDIAIYYDEISDAKTSAIRKLNVIDQYARVRIATRSSSNSEILAELNAVYEKIAACSEKSEMVLQANRAIYKIERILTSDAIINSCNDLKTIILAMEFIEKEEKDSFFTSISNLSARSKDAKEAENISALESIWKNFSDSIESIKSNAEAIDLSRAISSYVEKIPTVSTSYLEKIKKLKYISADKSDEIYNNIIELQKEITEEIPSSKSTSDVLEKYAKFLKKLDSIVDYANQEDLNGYKNVLSESLSKYEQSKPNYSDENYNKISAIIKEAKEKLISAQSKTECDNILHNADSEILLIKNLLDDEKDDALSSLLKLLESLKKESPLYSSVSFSKIEGLYEEGKIEINKITDISDIALVKQTLSKYITEMRSVNKDSIYTSEIAHNISTPSLQYPNDYDYSNGLLGSVHLSNGLISDAIFSLNLVEIEQNKQIEKLIQKSAKNGSLVTFQKIPTQTSKLLRSATVAATLDISLSNIVSGASGYTVQILIPNDLYNENILGLAFVKDGQVEFYPINRLDSLISAKLEHFSNYYIVVESTLNVKPLLIALIILLCLEFIVLAGIVYLRYKRKIETQATQNNLPELPMSAIIPFFPALTKVYPENGLTLTILLSIAAIALASTIALLVHKETKENNKRKDIQKQLKGRKEPMLLESSENCDKNTDVFFENK